MRGNDLKRLNEYWVRDLFKEEHLFLAVNTSVGIMRYLGQRIKEIEKVVKQRVRLRKEFEGLFTLPGVGDILGLTIMLEIGDIGRFVEAANFAIRDYPVVQGYYQRNAAKTNGVVAIKAVSHKLARASYYIMRDQVVYDAAKLFH
jgi:transposase